MESLTKILSVAVGGAFGATARYLINISPLHNLVAKFPFHTFFINILGSFLIGFCFVLFTDRWAANENLKLALVVGFLGAFTTFATFELEIWSLTKANQYLGAFIYLFLSVLVGFIGILAGIALAKRFL
jgi:CrcB protein